VFPLRDENPTVRPPVATVIVNALNVGAWLLLQGMGAEVPLARSICLFGLIPGELLGLVPAGTRVPVSGDLQCVIQGPGTLYTPITSKFMHGGWFHLLGNMWFLWIFGDNVEDAMGPVRFLVFYVLCGLAAAAAQVVTDPDSLIPMVGASGAIGGVMGAYIRLYPRAYVLTLLILGFYVTTLAVPAYAMLGYWFLLQLLGGIPALSGAGGGVAFWAHIGGFLAGLILVVLFSRRDYLAAHIARQPRRTARHRW
jgi:membrane associated rhomboid family serine protease